MKDSAPELPSLRRAQNGRTIVPLGPLYPSRASSIGIEHSAALHIRPRQTADLYFLVEEKKFGDFKKTF